MRVFKLIAQHYDMVPGTIVYKVGLFTDVYSVSKYELNNNLRIIPAEKLEEQELIDEKILN